MSPGRKGASVSERGTGKTAAMLQKALESEDVPHVYVVVNHLRFRSYAKHLFLRLASEQGVGVDRAGQYRVKLADGRTVQFIVPGDPAQLMGRTRARVYADHEVDRYDNWTSATREFWHLADRLNREANE